MQYIHTQTESATLCNCIHHQLHTIPIIISSSSSSSHSNRVKNYSDFHSLSLPVRFCSRTLVLFWSSKTLMINDDDDRKQHTHKHTYPPTRRLQSHTLTRIYERTVVDDWGLMSQNIAEQQQQLHKIIQSNNNIKHTSVQPQRERARKRDWVVVVVFFQSGLVSKNKPLFITHFWSGNTNILKSSLTAHLFFIFFVEGKSQYRCWTYLIHLFSLLSRQPNRRTLWQPFRLPAPRSFNYFRWISMEVTRSSTSRHSWDEFTFTFFYVFPRSRTQSNTTRTEYIHNTKAISNNDVKLSVGRISFFLSLFFFVEDTFPVGRNTRWARFRFLWSDGIPNETRIGGGQYSGSL